jgi:predicted nucleotidyltransferase
MVAKEEARREIEPAELDRLREAAARVFLRWPAAAAAYLHGSAARREPAADLDIAVAFAGDEPTFAELDRLAAELQTAAAIPGLEIDLRSLGPATPRFRANVLRDGELLFERDRRARASLEARFMSAWTDFQPTWHRMRARLLERWSRG